MAPCHPEPVGVTLKPEGLDHVFIVAVDGGDAATLLTIRTDLFERPLSASAHLEQTGPPAVDDSIAGNGDTVEVFEKRRGSSLKTTRAADPIP